MNELLPLLPLAGVLIATGCVAGILAGLLGVGGGIIVVPVLFTMLGLIDIDPSVRMHVAVGISLASIVLTSLVSARSHHKRGAVDTDLLKSWGGWIFAGSVAGTLIAGVVSGPALSAVFAVVALCVALYMSLTKPDFRVRDQLPSGPAGWASGSLIGGLSAMMGTLTAARAGSFAAVMKPMRGPGDGLLSFPMHGMAYAIDLPRRAGIEKVHTDIERIVLDHGGRLYVAKDALMRAESFVRMFPGLDAFREILAKVDPEARFQSDMSRRLRIHPQSPSG